jgi:hypothetical protein
MGAEWICISGTTEVAQKVAPDSASDMKKLKKFYDFSRYPVIFSPMYYTRAQLIS